MVDLKKLKEIDTFVTVPMIMEIFGISRRAVYNWINSGKLPPKQQLAGFTGWDPDFLRKSLGVKP